MIHGGHNMEAGGGRLRAQAEAERAMLAAIVEQRKATLWFMQILADKLQKADVPTVQLVRPYVPRFRWLHAMTGRQPKPDVLATGWSVVHGWRPDGIAAGRPHYVHQGLFISRQDKAVIQYVSLAEPPGLGPGAEPSCRQLPVVACREFGLDVDADFILWKYPPAGNPLDCHEPYRDMFWDDQATRRKNTLAHGLQVEAALQRYIEQLALDKR